jgi:hypothetical protein
MSEHAGFDQVVSDIYDVLSTMAAALAAGVPESVALTLVVDAAETVIQEFSAVNRVMRRPEDKSNDYF